MLLKLADWSYQQIVKPWLFRLSPENAHQTILKLAAQADDVPLLQLFLKIGRAINQHAQPIQVGGVQLSSPLILAAGLVKGAGFASEEDALSAVRSGQNIISGWRAIPLLLGPVEFGSFTRYPRLGNSGVTLWRHTNEYGIQNRIGLKNPGAKAAAQFLASKAGYLPLEFGINIAPSPGEHDEKQEADEISQTLDIFLQAGIHPSWFTLNLSCPNTDDDPLGHQTEAKVLRLCTEIQTRIDQEGLSIPLWVKISPNLAFEQYDGIARACHSIGVRAIIATNTLPLPTPHNPVQLAGMGGRPLYPYAINTVQILNKLRTAHHYDFDIIGCGGALDGPSYREFVSAGAKAIQYWSALVYRGPLAPALILSEGQ